VSEVGQVGVDVEFNQQDIDIEGIAKRYFHSLEYDQIKLLPDSEKLKLFYRCWTAKEAVVKTKGAGLLHCLDNFAINFTDLTKEKILWLSEDLKDLAKWTINLFDPSAHYTATVACTVKESDVTFKDFMLYKPG